jgi:competence protein ComEC
MSDPFYAAFRKAVPAGIPMKQVKRGERVTLGEVQVTVLHPNTTERRAVVLNDDSVVLRFQYRRTAALLPGDIQRNSERELLDVKLDLASVLLKCPHHGSRSSSTPEFLEAVHPEVVVICVGQRNRWGLPNAEVLAAYHKIGAQVLRTDTFGAVSVELDGTTWRRVEP